MITQQFQPFLSVRTLRAVLLAALSVLVISGCDDVGEDVLIEPERVPAENCSPPCNNTTMGCFENPPGQPACFEYNCPSENPTMACSDDAVCIEDGVGAPRCEFDFSCSPECTGDTECSGGHCIPKYTSDNVCDPLENCRTQCGPNPACLQACEKDRSATCASCMDNLDQCRATYECEPSATGCCSDAYCECFPGSPECSADTPCLSCWNQCQSAGDPVACLAQCAEGYPTCASCLQPFINQCTDGESDELSQDCIDLFEDCTGSAP